MLEGEVVSSRDAGQGLMEYFVKTTDKSVPYLKIRTNKPALSIGSKVFLDISYFKEKAWKTGKAGVIKKRNITTNTKYIFYQKKRLFVYYFFIIKILIIGNKYIKNNEKCKNKYWRF